MDALIAGFLLGFGLILAIGAQNAFVLRQGLRGDHVLPVALTCAASDAVLIAGGVAGFGALQDAAPWVGPLLLWGGVAFLVVHGARSAWSAWSSTDAALDPADAPARPLGPTIATCLALTWLNPHVYLDTLVFLGSISAQYGSRAWLFAVGAMTASFTFFFSLAYGARLLRPLFARPRAWRVLDALVALVMWAIALKLALGD